jgi:hypothetical protein
MLIKDKRKDYYDYICHQYKDPSLVYERNGMEVEWPHFLYRALEYHSHFRGVSYICLEVGSTQYIFELHLKGLEKEFYSGVLRPKDATFILLNKISEQKKLFTTPIAIGRVNYNYKKYTSWKRPEFYTLKKFDDFQVEKFEKYFGANYTIFENPILKDIKIPSFIKPEEIYKELVNYFSWLKGDKAPPEISNDIDKAINHGFDKKESFRHPIKL